jgi:hypothetical protein
MAERLIDLSEADFKAAITAAAQSSGRPAYLLEKDLWVVWSLDALFRSPLGQHMTFKGGTSLSKVFKAIDRFSEDVDITYDIRQLIPDLAAGKDLPISSSQQSKWTKAVRERLPPFLTEQVRPLLDAAIAGDGLGGRLSVEISGEKADSLLIAFPRRFNGPNYVAPYVRLEFGARATGEPHAPHPVTCDMDGILPDLILPTATAQTMCIERTAWEKATAAHVFCAKQTFRGDGERFSRHWFDLACLYASPHFAVIKEAQEVAKAVAIHKALFFREKDAADQVIDYGAAITGKLHLVPTGDALHLLKDDYEQMAASNMFFTEPPSFDDVMTSCGKMASEMNMAMLDLSKRLADFRARKAGPDTSTKFEC